MHLQSWNDKGPTLGGQIHRSVRNGAHRVASGAEKVNGEAANKVAAYVVQ